MQSLLTISCIIAEVLLSGWETLECALALLKIIFILSLVSTILSFILFIILLVLRFLTTSLRFLTTPLRLLTTSSLLVFSVVLFVFSLVFFILLYSSAILCNLSNCIVAIFVVSKSSLLKSILIS